jgi:tetratricopeptide (TPR) repeat protein
MSFPRAILIVLLFVNLAAVGCSGLLETTKTISVPVTDEIEITFEPIFFDVSDEEIEVYNIAQLFERAGELYDEGEFLKAYGYYQKLIDKYPATKYIRLALYNSGLCAEQLGRTDAATYHYLVLITKFAPRDINFDAYYRLGEIYELSGELEKSLEYFRRALARKNAPRIENADILARIGILTYELAKQKDEAALRDKALDILGEATRQYTKYKKKHLLVDNAYYIKALIVTGDIFFDEMQRIKLELPVEVMEERLERKAQLLLLAQGYYLDAVRQRNPELAQEAVYKVGDGYDSFYRQMNEAPVPQDLTDEQRQVYDEEVRRITEPVREKARYAYRRLVQFSRTFNTQTDWIVRAQDRLDAIIAQIEAEPNLPSLPDPATSPTSTPESDL